MDIAVGDEGTVVQWAEQTCFVGTDSATNTETSWQFPLCKAASSTIEVPALHGLVSDATASRRA
jgi:hypothetical protein